MFTITLMAEQHNGNDPLEALTQLPVVPRKGDTIEVWDSTSVHLDVETVVLCSYAPERIEVWVRMDGYDLDDLDSAMHAVNIGATP